MNENVDEVSEKYFSLRVRTDFSGVKILRLKLKRMFTESRFYGLKLGSWEGNVYLQDAAREGSVLMRRQNLF